jgi:PKD repeat protein
VTATNPVNSCQTQSIVPFYQNFSGAGLSSFSYTVAANGVTTFSNTTNGINPSCVWDFGDGYITIGNSVSHTYSVAGLYPVKLDVYDSGASCFKTSVSNVNVSTVPCTANTNFTAVPTSTPHHWNVIPAYPWNFSNAVWNWGDGSTSNNLYSSHTYSATGFYTLCLTATVSCGTSSSTCNSYYLYKSSSSAAMIQVNVIPPNSIATSVNNQESDITLYSVYPNPTSGELNVKVESATPSSVTIRIYNLIGNEVYSSFFDISKEELNKTINLKHLSDGVYFVKLASGDKVHVHKLVITK